MASDHAGSLRGNELVELLQFDDIQLVPHPPPLPLRRQRQASVETAYVYAAVVDAVQHIPRQAGDALRYVAFVRVLSCSPRIEKPDRVWLATTLVKESGGIWTSMDETIRLL